jgi:peptide/nickel transport system substrate-binding protein
MIGRRALLAGAGAAVLATVTADRAQGRPRTPYGGLLSLHVPWPLGRIDPHKIDDPAAALFGDALFDALYARDETGALVPSLAEADPELDRGGLRVRMRAGVRFAGGLPFDARAAAASIERARSHDASAWLADVSTPRVDGEALVFRERDARKLVRALASPLVAMVPPRFTPERPDGTGAFRAVPDPGGLRLARNTLAANGPSFLDAIDLRHASDLATSLRAFESGADDVGWLGSFLHEPRAAARDFDGGAVGWAILRTGRDAGALDTPGTAQALADGIAPAGLAALVVGPLWVQGPGRWTGPRCDLVVRDDAPWLIEVARAAATGLSTPSHEVTHQPIPAAEIAQRRASRAFVLMLDVARPAGPGDLGILLGIATADDPSAAMALARHPPRGAAVPRAVTRSMRAGVVGEMRVQGGRAGDVALPLSPWGRGVDWGAASRSRR